jgi:signal transduction histidine kinase
MKVTAALKKELAQWLDTYWTTYLKGDIETWATFIRDDYRNIGGTKEEIWNSRQEIIDYTNSIMDQMLDTVEIRNREIEVIPYGEYMMVNEFTDLFVKIDGDWTFYGPFRMSSLLEKTDTGWIALHQHGSYPDMKALEGEAFSIDSLKAENAKLQEAVKSRTIELENKNRELEMEAALERVRTVAMSMHKPDDLLDVCQIISEQLEMLNVNNIRNVQVAIINESKKSYSNYQFFDAYAKRAFEETGYENNPASKSMVQEMQKSANSFFIGSIKGEELEKFNAWRKEYGQFPDPIMDELTEVFYYFYSIGEGGLGLTTYEAISESELEIFKRFHLVFKLAYRRFMDIQQAEAQTREAQIEAALERTRTQSMLMQQSDEIINISAVFHQQLLQLNIPTEFSYVWLPDEQKNDHQFWASWEEDEKGNKTIKSKQITYPLDKSEPYTAACYAAWANPNTTHIQFIPPADVPAFFDVWQELLDGAKKLKARFFPQGIYYAEAYMKYGCFGINIRRELSQGEKEVLKKFSIEFERAYTRFLDLRKAEAQAKEARIEAALERIRSRALAMRNSSEVGNVSTLLFSELEKMDINPSGFSIMIFDEEQDKYELWRAKEVPHQGVYETFSIKAMFDKLDQYLPGFGEELKSTWANGKPFFIGEFRGKKRVSFLQANREMANYSDEAFEKMKMMFPDPTFWHLVFFKYGWFGVLQNEQLHNEDLMVIHRFAEVFDFAFTRFLDLQKAEAQKREAEIELALERVRARTMAMQHSDELADASFLLDSQVRALGIQTRGCAFNIYGESDSTEWFSSEMGTMPTYKTPRENIFLHYYEEGQKGKPMYIDSFVGDDCAAHYDYLCTLPVMGEALKKMKESGVSFPTQQIDHVTYFKYGYLLFITLEPVPESHDIFLRFAKVFEQTYTRFLDLQKAEAQAREAQIEAALERVRSRTMGMRGSDELQDAAMVLFQQVEALGVPVFGCGFNIWDDDRKAATAWMAGKDRFQPPFKTSSSEDIFIRIHESSKNGESLFVEEQEGEALSNHYKYLTSIPGFKMIADNMAKEGHSLPAFQIMQCAFFSQGYLMFITYEKVPDAHDIFKRFTKVFEQTYTRFLDLQKAEALALRAEKDLIAIKAARQKAEEALTELKTTQSQLIQSEKMASLGELTAGIAHEIQNPLNFVNNFSEVSNELLDEMKLELDRGDTEEAKAIASDVKINLEKILHHGKRADAIVKGMLQHSRSSSGLKEPTDINALADEYLRLAYHGLRAKDKSFNATLKTEFDETIGKIDIIPQDIARVILNLITNAFYAVDEKKKQNPDGYEPTVSVCTHRSLSPGEGWGEVKISVKDNGPGIPQKVLDKIFQPFFTTKPTGQGTGLGLSLAYDIVKAHGGELKVETEEGIGTEFIIRLFNI